MDLNELGIEQLKLLIENTVKETLTELLEQQHLPLCEGIDIDAINKVISFNPMHQNNVDTNDYIHPYIIENDVNGNSILSIFERKDNEVGIDGNPLVYALKGVNGWHFVNPQYDIMALLRRFTRKSVTMQLQKHFDVLILTPSNHILNNIVFGYLKRLIAYDEAYSSFFKKLTANEVMEEYFDEGEFENIISSETDEGKKWARGEIVKAFTKMNQNNGGMFSYRYISPLVYRNAITKSMNINFSGHSVEEYSKIIDGKDVLVFDDTIASGKTLSDSANTLRSMFTPNTITFLTLFSPKIGRGFKNIRKTL